jgi:DNA-binding response OmpR family regulator
VTTVPPETKEGAMVIEALRGHTPPRAPTVLVIDDDRATQDLLAALLEPAGYTLLHALSGEAGLVLLERAAVDLVVLDLRLPGLDGFEVCARIRACGVVQPAILVVTATTRPQGVATILQVGADDYLAKPYAAAELLARIAVLLRRPWGGASRPAQAAQHCHPSALS